MNNNELTIKISNDIIKYHISDNTIVKDLLIFLFNKYNYYNDPITDNNLIGTFSFINKEYGEQKAILNYNLKSFLNNFNYDYQNVLMKLYLAYGIGGSFDFEEIAKISINSSEPNHGNPHVHIYRIGKIYPTYRIDLNTFTQLKGDKKDWKDEFNNKERKKIIDMLKLNQKSLIDFYNRCKKGEYIKENYTLIYDNKEYNIITNRSY